MNPPPLTDEVQFRKDNDHLKLLSVFHFVMAGFALFGILFLVVHGFIMSQIFMNPEIWKGCKEAPPPALFGTVFVCLYALFGCVEVVKIVLNLLSGFFLWQKKHRIFSLIVAGVNCVSCPGVILGVFTFVVLLRDSVRRMYEATAKGT